MNAKLLIMGATSGIGAAAVDEALSRGLCVRAFSRSAGQMPARDGLERHPGDALNAGDLRAALEGVTAVIYALGIKERLAMLWEEETLFSESTRILIDEMATAGVSRVVAVTGLGAGKSRMALSAVERLAFTAILGKPYEDKARQEALLMASDLDWTIVRPAILTNGARSGRVQVLRSPETWRNGLVSRKDVAVYLVDAVAEGLDIRSDVVLAR
ncbi:MAG: SDR family oxidoreductase [Paracoccaceae bacterium]|nr:SDR family oxidoreductase [Paracoccaceae bacterium]